MSEELQRSPATGKINLDTYLRLAGLLFLAFGLFFGIFGFYLPIQDAYEGAALSGWKQKAANVSVLIPLLLATFLADHFFEEFLEGFGYKF